jgi:hypothetical protein
MGDSLTTYKACIQPYFKVAVSGEEQAAIVCDRLANVSLMIETTNSQAEQVYLKLRGYVAAEFYRTEFNSRYDGFKLPRGRGEAYQGVKRLIADEVALWSLALKLLERMATFNKLPLPYEVYPGYAPAVSPTLACFFALVMEGEFLMNYAAWDEGGLNVGQDELFRFRQRQNSRMWDIATTDPDPPALPCHRPMTKLFLENAIELTNGNELFQKKFYFPLMRQKRKITARLMKEKAQVINSKGRRTKQGRKQSH